NFIIPERKTLGLVIHKWGDDMEKLFWNSLISKNGVDKLLMVTTLSGKVYVGYINKISKPIGNAQITIIPNFSGYRDKEDHQFFITTDYLEDRKSTRLNSSHVKISYAVFCLKKKKK